MTVTIIRDRPDPTKLPLRATLAASSCLRKTKDVIEVRGASSEKLEISFQRTLRGADGRGDARLPPNMGSFPLYSVVDYQGKLPKRTVEEGGVLMPMYRKLSFRFSGRAPIQTHTTQNARRCGLASDPNRYSPSRSTWEG